MLIGRADHIMHFVIHALSGRLGSRPIWRALLPVQSGFVQPLMPISSDMTSRLTSRRSQPPLALSVRLSRFTSRAGGGSAFFVRLTRRMSALDHIDFELSTVDYIFNRCHLGYRLISYGLVGQTDWSEVCSENPSFRTTLALALASYRSRFCLASFFVI